MSNKKLYIVLGIMFISLTINGCQSNDSSSIVSAFSDSVIEIEIPEPADSLNRDSESSENKIDADVSIGGEDTISDEELAEDLGEIPEQENNSTGTYKWTEEEDKELAQKLGYDELPEDLKREYASMDDNDGKGYEFRGQHYDTWGEYLRARHEQAANDPNAKTNEEMRQEAEALRNGGVTYNE